LTSIAPQPHHDVARHPTRQNASSDRLRAAAAGLLAVLCQQNSCAKPRPSGEHRVILILGGHLGPPGDFQALLVWTNEWPAEGEFMQVLRKRGFGWSLLTVSVLFAVAPALADARDKAIKHFNRGF